ncbi:opioid growth factor receptor-like protein 1 [Bufo gargarizans]|uniref:opioid growth factor receptor-like protein 1 n=1 Tax=Bufo gargarizans TaxID=30331 RepID=UPI001CF3FA5E|nr:opioid growth factor receptor-like protein 1 [Bufo gargarizans]
MSRDGGEDGWTSQYDSTWEDEEEEDGRKEERAREPRTQPRHNYPRRWRNRAARDLQCYRHGYRGELSSDQPCMGENSRTMPNLDFYQNKKCFEPNGLYIEELLSEWKEDYNTLERNHSYIQWLFPLREFGMNSYAKPLTLHEIKMMMEDKAVMARFLEAYKLMLGFYGIKLVNEETGEVARAENWEDRFKNLNYHSHNNLRITRILKCLGEMGYNHFQAPLVKFFLEETLLRDKLPNVKRSVLDYFMFAVKDKHERRKLVHFAWENYKSNNHQDKFIWGPVEKLKHFHLREQNAMNAGSEELRDDAEKNTVSKTYKNQEKQFIKFSESSRARGDKVTASQHGSKVEKATGNELIPMKDRAAFPENSTNHNTETSPDQSTPLFKDSNSIIGLEKDNIQEIKHVEKKEERVDYENAKEDSNIEDLTKKVRKEEVIKKIKDDQEGALEFNGLSNCGDIQNENKHHQGEHQRKRKMQVHSPISPLADGCASGDGTQSSHNASPSQAVDEVGQVEGVEDEVKKLKLVERAATDCPNGREEKSYPHDTTPGERAIIHL